MHIEYTQTHNIYYWSRPSLVRDRENYLTCTVRNKSNQGSIKTISAASNRLYTEVNSLAYATILEVRRISSRLVESSNNSISLISKVISSQLLRRSPQELQVFYKETLLCTRNFDIQNVTRNPVLCLPVLKEILRSVSGTFVNRNLAACAIY